MTQRIIWNCIFTLNYQEIKILIFFKQNYQKIRNLIFKQNNQKIKIQTLSEESKPATKINFKKNFVLIKSKNLIATI